MNRLEILVLDRKNGIISNEYVDIPSMMSFLVRSGRSRSLQIVARKGEKALFIERIDMTTIQKQLTEFQSKP
jgi:hypothetical protein